MCCLPSSLCHTGARHSSPCPPWSLILLHHQHALMYTVRYLVLYSALQGWIPIQMSGPTTPTTTQFCTGTKCNTMQQSQQNTLGGNLETKHQTFINDCLSLSTIFHVFDWLNLVYLLYICISSGIPSQNCCRECVMMPKLMTRTQYC